MNIITVIVANNNEYLQQCVDSALQPYIVYDGIGPIEEIDCQYFQCNANRPSIAKNLALQNINWEGVDFVQFLDSDDYLASNYYEKVIKVIESNNDYDLFYTNYSILNEDFNFTNREYLNSISSDFKKEDFTKIKNPIIRIGKSVHLFNNEMSCFEYIDLISKIGPSKCYHIPKDLQTIRLHAKSQSRMIRKEEVNRSFSLIDWEKING